MSLDKFNNIIDSVRYKTLNGNPSLDSDQVYQLFVVLKDELLKLKEQVKKLEKNNE